MITSHSSSKPLSKSDFSARAVALSTLIDSVSHDDGLDVLLERRLAPGVIDSRDRSLAMELTYGVLRRRATLDWRLQPLLKKPLPRLPILIQMILRLGAYQVLYLDRIPPAAAVNESVLLSKSVRNTL
ncbi:MAG TPA: transcription antitermination factor NusB [Nitrospiraceae bacterium]